MQTETQYGFHRDGSSRFVVVAPHGKDDAFTTEIADIVARELDAALVANTRFIKPTNSAAADHPELVQDFNHLPWSERRQRVDFARVDPAMRAFYERISADAVVARDAVAAAKAVVVYIHGMKDGADHLGVDIGFGARSDDGALKGTRGSAAHPQRGSCTGVVRASRADMERLRDRLDEHLLQQEVHAGIGERFAAWSRTNGIQYHAGTPDYSFQLEIAHTLRADLSTRRETAYAIAQALRETYNAR